MQYLNIPIVTYLSSKHFVDSTLFCCPWGISACELLITKPTVRTERRQENEMKRKKEKEKQVQIRWENLYGNFV